MFDGFVHVSRRNLDWFARVSIFVIYFWFGLLKVLGLSPASGLVAALLERTIPFLTPEQFIFAFGAFEMLVGLLFLKRGWEKLAIPLFFLHMATTFGPLVMLPAATWQQAGVPTLEGQYIIKNLALIACVLAIAARMRTSQEIARG